MQQDVKSPSRLAICLILIILAAPVIGGEVELKDTDYPRLVGKWRGQLTVEIGRVSQGAASDFTNKFALVIKEDNTGKFTDLKSGKKWNTKATIEQGKVMLRFAREQRPFTYSESDGRAMLSLSFEQKKGGKVRAHNLELTKQ